MQGQRTPFKPGALRYKVLNTNLLRDPVTTPSISLIVFVVSAWPFPILR
jgi:hypothetical protein